jgi:hypothetical protein
LAGLVSLLPVVAEKRQGNSIRWSVSGDELQVEYFQLPSFSHVRSYRLDTIESITTAPDSRNPKLTVVRLRLNGLNLNIPSQSSALIWNFDSYSSDLEGFLARVKDGDTAASYSWHHPWLLAGVGAIPVAVVLWVVVFGVLIAGRPRAIDGAGES